MWFGSFRFLRRCDHPNILTFHGCYLHEMTICLAMELALGSVTDVMEVFKAPLNEAEIAVVAHDVLAALAYLHPRGRAEAARGWVRSQAAALVGCQGRAAREVLATRRV